MAVIRQRWRSKPSMWRFSISTNIRHSCVLLVVVTLINCVVVVFINLLSVFVDYDGSSSFESELTIRSCVEMENTLMGVPDSVSRVCQSRNGRLLSDAICLNLTCQNLIRASSSEDPIYSYAVSFMEFNDNTQNLRESDIISMTSDCKKFRKSRGFDRKSISDTEDFPIAFNVIVHRDIEQIERLIYALYRPHNQFCIHSDLKSSEDFQRALFGIAECLPNVFLASERVNIIYAGFSRLQADINCMKDHLERKHTWKYLINSAGQSYPLRTIKEIVDILRIYNGSNDIEGIYGKKVHTNRFEYQWLEWENSTQPVPSHRKNPKPPHDLEIIKGSAYGIFSRAFVEFAVTDPVAKDLLKWSERTWSPDEHFWATLHHTYSNPHLRPPGGYAGNLHYLYALQSNNFRRTC